MYLIKPLRDHLPLQQGLRLLYVLDRFKNPCLRDHLPLQQGLRQAVYTEVAHVEDLRDHLPLQQGLRLLILHSEINHIESPRPSSITTRIKT